jgi:hypothetical protein
VSGNDSMRKHQTQIGSLCFAVVLFAAPSVAAQSVATKDFTEIADVPFEHTNTSDIKPEKSTAADSAHKDCVVGFRDGVIVREPQEKLHLAIVNTEPRLVYAQTPITVTVRLKNVGDHRVLIPWETHQVESDIDPKTGATRYESATIQLEFGTLPDRKNNSYLKGEATLVAAPSRREQHVELLSGQWVDIKLKAAIQCDSTESLACEPFNADEHAQLTAHWWESLFTYEEEGCSVWRGAYKSRMLNSSPMEVVYVALPRSDASNTAPKR